MAVLALVRGAAVGKRCLPSLLLTLLVGLLIVPPAFASQLGLAHSGNYKSAEARSGASSLRGTRHEVGRSVHGTVDDGRGKRLLATVLRPDVRSAGLPVGTRLSAARGRRAGGATSGTGAIRSAAVSAGGLPAESLLHAVLVAPVLSGPFQRTALSVCSVSCAC